MHRFAFIIHPLDARRDVARKYPIARYLPERVVERLLLTRKPMPVATVTGVRSALGPRTEGLFIGCPLTPRMFLSLPLARVYNTLEQCGRIAEEYGAEILGLGAFTSVVGDGGITLAGRLRIAVTTGNSYTVATALEGAKSAAERMGIEPSQATVAVVGATGSIGATCAEILAQTARKVVLIGRDTERLERLAASLKGAAQADLEATTDVAAGLRYADVVIAVSSAAKAIVMPEHLKSGAVVCDVARPRDVSTAVARTRKDVLVIEGGVVKVPGEMICTRVDRKAPFSFGFPPGTAYACMSETMALALDGRLESFTLGKEVSTSQVTEISEICRRHGFRLAGYRSFEKAVTDEEIAAIRLNAEAARAAAVSA